MDSYLQTLVRQWRADPSDTEIAQKIAAAVSRSEQASESENLALLINEQQAGVILRALDLFSRIQMGQVAEVLEPFRYEHLGDESEIPNENLWEAQALVNAQLKPLLFPGMPANASHGIRSPNTPESAKVAYDIQQVVRHRLAWDRDENSDDDRVFRGVHHDSPWASSQQPLPRILGPSPCKCNKPDCKDGKDWKP